MPDKLTPIIPYATMYQGDCLMPIKKDSLLVLYEVIREIKTNSEKYINNIKVIDNGDNIQQRKKNTL